MRIAVSGTHRVGKTTLAEQLADVLPGHGIVDEPYHDMVAEGHVFSQPPTLEDFEDQLEHSLLALGDGSPDLVFDRCPIDLLAYLLVGSADSRSVVERWVQRIRATMQSLDVIIFVPIESPDRIDLAEEHDTFARSAVDRELRELLLNDPLGLGVEVLEVRGAPRNRVSQVLRRLTGVSSEEPR